MLHDLILSFCVTVGCIFPVEYAVVPPVEMPGTLIAHTTVNDGVCLLTFTPSSSGRKDVIAHEVCHCGNDRLVLGPYGYENLSQQAIARREFAARNCAARLLEDE